ncbi:hypothetical protein ABT352_39050 [Streptosporangium sp. NPDC000563]|uniref:hypothetical protein n=1 Tax=Streptosporangium sp. NPDC000563 TaxID=3154366 RepID=UPI0033263002
MKGPVQCGSVWQVDHQQAPVEVDVGGGMLVKPWIIWFVDSTTNAICGITVAPGSPNRASILAALRFVLLEQEPYNPTGTASIIVYVDRGKDFLSPTVASALRGFGATVELLPAYSPYLKGAAEVTSRAMEVMLLSSMPCYSSGRKTVNNIPVDLDQLALSFEDFVCAVLNWATWWNSSRRNLALGESAPLQAWQQGPASIESVETSADNIRAHRDEN